MRSTQNDAGLGVSKRKWQAYKGGRKSPERMPFLSHASIPDVSSLTQSVSAESTSRWRTRVLDDATLFLSSSSAPAASKRDNAAETMWAGPEFDVFASQHHGQRKGWTMMMRLLRLLRPHSTAPGTIIKLEDHSQNQYSKRFKQATDCSFILVFIISLFLFRQAVVTSLPRVCGDS
jgi:hypothetical protein